MATPEVNGSSAAADNDGVDPTTKSSAVAAAKSAARSPEEIQAEIENQREQLAETLDALGAKLDVKAQAQAKVADVKDRATTDAGKPRPELLVMAATVVVVAGVIVWWRHR